VLDWMGDDRSWSGESCRAGLDGFVVKRSCDGKDVYSCMRGRDVDGRAMCYASDRVSDECAVYVKLGEARKKGLRGWRYGLAVAGLVVLGGLGLLSLGETCVSKSKADAAHARAGTTASVGERVYRYGAVGVSWATTVSALVGGAVVAAKRGDAT
jgi:hypothetical protein